MLRTRRWMVTFIAILLVSLLVAPIALADDDEYEFRGTVESLPSSGLIGDWVVSGRTVHVSAETRIDQEDGPVAVGA
ncbi:MAG: hypothetical protein GXP39_06015, partial [Chloroflexi bacterium]|nr:hypothetical protein [Chloroflexota bacterium]